jgi:hypothetical protein
MMTKNEITTFGVLISELAKARTEECEMLRDADAKQRAEKASDLRSKIQLLLDICRSAAEVNGGDGALYFFGNLFISETHVTKWPTISPKDRYYRAQVNILQLCVEDGTPCLRLLSRSNDVVMAHHVGSVMELAPILVSYLADMIRHR